MKKLTLVIGLFALLLSPLQAAQMLTFDQLRESIRTDVIDEIGTAPTLISDISQLVDGMDQSFVALYEKDGKSYSFHLHIFYGTQGAAGAVVSHITEISVP